MFTITYSNGISNSHRGPFSSLEEATEIFRNAPVMDGESAYLCNENDDVIERIDGFYDDDE